jgi:hypothetical protein
LKTTLESNARSASVAPVSTFVASLADVSRNGMPTANMTSHGYDRKFREAMHIPSSAAYSVASPKSTAFFVIRSFLLPTRSLVTLSLAQRSTSASQCFTLSNESVSVTWDRHGRGVKAVVATFDRGQNQFLNVFRGSEARWRGKREVGRGTYYYVCKRLKFPWTLCAASPVRDIVDEDNTVCPAVVATSDRPKPFLPCT